MKLPLLLRLLPLLALLATGPLFPAQAQLPAVADTLDPHHPSPHHLVGRVHDERNIALAGATVELRSTDSPTRTLEVAVANGEGYFLLSAVPVTGAVLQVSFAGFFSQSHPVPPQLGYTHPHLDVELKPMPGFQRTGKQASYYRRKVRALDRPKPGPKSAAKSAAKTPAQPSTAP